MAERTEPASPKRRREARERGQVARSAELSAGVQLLVGAGLVAWLGPVAFARLAELTARVLRVAPARPLPPGLTLQAGLQTGAMAALPALAVLAAVGALVAFAQVGPGTSVKAIEPRFDRIDPVAGLRRLWSLHSLYGLAKNLIKLAVVGWILWGVVVDLVPTIAGLVGAPATAIGAALGGALVRLLVRGGAILVAIGVADLFVQRARLARELRMTKEEVKREQREQEGDPQHKAQRSRLHREILTHARIEEVRFADVVVVNPDHIAIALQYDDEQMEAPKVLAKGDDALAKQIIDVARAHGVPIVRDVTLARALRELDVDQEIPEDLYDAVAEVLRLAYAERDAEQGRGEPGGPDTGAER